MLLEISFQFTFGTILLVSLKSAISFPSGSDGLQCGRPRFDPWVRKIPWRSDWLPTPVFLPGESHGQRSLAGYRSKGHKESDMSEWLTHTHTEKRIPQKLATAAISPCFLSGELIVKHCPAYQHSRLCLCLYFWCLFLSSFQTSASLFLLFPYWPVISEFLCV